MRLSHTLAQQLSLTTNPGSLVPRPHVLQVMESWAGPGNEAKFLE